ncbi:MAG: universal stress protein [Desulforhopalus sp.]
MKKFVVAYSGSKVSKAALSLARDHAEIFGAHVVVVTSMIGGAGERAEDIGKTNRDLQFAKGFLQEKEISCEVRELVRGVTPGEDLVKFAHDNNVDQIYVGIEKKSRTQKIILGSNAQYIILKAPCPVVSVNQA